MPDRRFLATALVLAFGLAGCGGGNAAPTTTSATTASTQATTSTAPAKPARPRDLDLTGVAACELLSEQQRTTLGVDQPPKPGHSTTFDADDCFFINRKENTNFFLVPISKQGIERFGPGRVNGRVRDGNISGYLAYEVWTETTPGSQFCTVHVDVSDGQTLRSHYAEGGRKQPLGRTTLCTRAAQVAEAALATLSKK
ncbi:MULTISPECIES: DUF3558 family protein [unclassified Crossiella]|uniref:DUF3558 family protein n=1 Tax=unclassified Crossiella TaxID=2620835 RepID=UPI0020002C63|nr:MULTISPECIES: DUF3558 family protein [unclassified Crossiella]MCK2241293.1 DUF3558 domain-containing protein [Crossiella sp. S99.2]MCK2253563.1 DUF3558 domain-containing protein [Crossiella sp. S99.1]